MKVLYCIFIVYLFSGIHATTLEIESKKKTTTTVPSTTVTTTPVPTTTTTLPAIFSFERETKNKYGITTFSSPYGVTTAFVNGSSQYYLTDWGRGHIISVHEDGTLIKYITKSRPIAVVSSGQEIYVSDLTEKSITKYDLNLNLIKKVVGYCTFTSINCMQAPVGLFYDKSSDLLYAADDYAEGVHIFDSNLNLVDFISVYPEIPKSVAYLSNKLYVAISGNKVLVIENKRVTQRLDTSCKAQFSTQSMHIYNNQFILINCADESKIYIYDLDMTPTGNYLTTSGRAISVSSDEHGRVLVTNQGWLTAGLDIFS